MEYQIVSALRKFLLFVLLLAVQKTLYSQFIFTKQNSYHNNVVSVRNELSGNNLLLVNEKTSNFQLNGIRQNETEILKISQGGNILQNVILDSNFILQRGIIDDGIYYYAFGIKIKNHSSSQFSVFPTILKFDNNLNLIAKVNLDSLVNTFAASPNLVLKNNKLYACYTVYSLPNKIKFFSLTKNIVKVDSAEFSGSGFSSGASVQSMIKYGDSLIIGANGFPQGSNFGNFSVFTMDTLFNLSSQFKLDSITSVNPLCYQKVGIGYPAIKTHEINSNKYFITGFSSVVFDPSCQNNYKIVNGAVKNNQFIDGSSIVGTPNKNDLHSFESDFSVFKNNFITSVAMSGYITPTLNLYPPQNHKSDIILQRYDTAANVIFVKFFGSTDMYYNPLAVNITADSNIVISGIRYDYSNPAVFNISEGFVLLLDKNGNYLSTGVETKDDYISRPLVYPSYTDDKIYIKLQSNEAAQLEIIDTFGKIIMSNQNYKSQTEISLSKIAPGVCYYKLIIGSNIYYGKIIKTE